MHASNIDNTTGRIWGKQTDTILIFLKLQILTQFFIVEYHAEVNRIRATVELLQKVTHSLC